MKTWEMIKILDESPEKRFRNKKWKDFVVTADDKGKLCYNKQVFVLNLNGEWEEVNEPVDFMTAIKSGKKIKVEHECINGAFDEMLKRLSTKYHYLDEVLYVLGNCINSDDVVRDIALNGKWYIED